MADQDSIMVADTGATLATAGHKRGAGQVGQSMGLGHHRNGNALVGGSPTGQARAGPGGAGAAAQERLGH